MTAQKITRTQTNANGEIVPYEVVEITAGGERFYVEPNSDALKSIEPLVDWVD